MSAAGPGNAVHGFRIADRAALVGLIAIFEMHREYELKFIWVNDRKT